MNTLHVALTVEQIEVGNNGIVHAVSAPTHAPECKQWLEEIGFSAGEQVHLMARGMPGGDPLVMRVETPRLHCVAQVVNPNCGKSALFNRLTGSRQKLRITRV